MMPLADGQLIPQEVYNSLNNQRVKIDILPVTRPRELFGYDKLDPVFRKKLRPERKSISTCRNILRDIVTKREEEFFLHIDSDVVFKTDNDVGDMIDFLKENPKVGVVSLNTKPFEVELIPHHIPMACLLFRKTILEQITFHNGGYDTKCNCSMLCRDVRALGHPDGGKWEIRYLDLRQLSEIGR